ncbi:MAG TPA: carboxypeptidase-like regulatory domain-containing protein [Candidatus Sulfotelmatobacter sp.]|nr:carboxypeptidase-like regulatory domain-containing protein [Candidatus Sulfotelmatobacter sp.]
MRITSGWGLFRVGVWALEVCLVAGYGMAQDSSVPAPKDEATESRAEAHFFLSGNVINSVTGEPVRRAVVQISGRNGSAALTDAGGHFVLEGLSEGVVFLTVMKPGFFADEGASSTPARVGEDAPNVVLKLTPWGVISGRVTTKDEQPLEGFHVQVFGRRNLEGRMVWSLDPSNQGGVTNEEGEFRVAGLKAGTYYVSVEQSAVTVLTQKGIANAREQTFARVFYPGVAEMSAATPIEVAAGEEVEASFSLAGEPLYTVDGSVGANSGAATVTFERKIGDEVDYTQMVAVQGGEFEVNVPAGTYSVSAETSDGKDLVAPGATMIRADERDLHVALRAPTTIPVEVVREQGGTGSERRVSIPQGVPGVRVQLESVSQFRANVWTGQAGGIPNLPPGTYRVQITTDGGWWVKSAQRGGVDLLSNDLTVVEGEQPAPIEVVIRDGAGTVSGRVTPAGDPGHAIVLLVQAHGARNLIRSTIATAGNFTIAGVAPGDYAIVALNNGDRVEYADADALNAYLSDAEQVSVQGRGTVMVNLGLTAVEK